MDGPSSMPIEPSHTDPAGDIAKIFSPTIVSFVDTGFLMDPVWDSVVDWSH